MYRKKNKTVESAISIILGKLKRITSTFVGTAVIATAIVGALALCAWFSYVMFKTYLETPHTYGDTKVTPFGHHMDGPVTHSWDSLQIENNGTVVTLRNVAFDLSILGDDKGLKLGTNEVDVNLNMEGPEKPKTPPANGPPTFPSRAKFYLPVNADVGKVSVTAGDKHWEVEGLSLRSEGLQQASLGAKKISGTNVPQSASLRLKADFSGDNVSLDATVATATDSVSVQGDLPKDNLTAVSTKFNMEVKDPTVWIPVELPPSVPELGKLQVSGEASLDPATGKPRYKTTIKTRIGEFWPLLALNTTVHFSGDDERFHTEIHMENDDGGTIDLEADFDKNLNGTASGKVERMNAKFGPQIMPLDLTIHSAEKEGNKMNVIAETRQGSVVETTMNFEDKFSLTYFGDMSPYEPWALDWSMGQFELQERFKIYGSFSDGHMKALVKIDTIPYVWHVTADSLQIMLDLTRNGIKFSNGIIYTPKETFDVTGDVVWNGEKPHTSWRVSQRHGGVCEAYISIIDSTAIDIKSDSVEISTIPFAKIKLSENLNGRVTGTWKQNFDTKIGELEAAISGNVQPFNLEGQIKAHQNGDTVFIENAQASHSKNRVEAEAIFILPNDSNPNFTPTGTLPVQIVHAWTQARDFSIPLLLEPLGDTTFASGFISGDLSYNENIGLQGNVNFSDVEFNTISPLLFNVKRMNMFAEANKVELNAYLGIGGGGWTGNTQIILDDVFKSNRHVSISHSSDNGGDLYAEGFIDSTLTFNGKLNLNGSWFIPGTVSEVKKTDLEIDVSARIKEGLMGITADIRSDSTLYQPPKFNYIFPIRLRGHLENGILNMSEISTQNDSGETVSGTLRYNLDSLRIMDIEFQSDRYTLVKGPHKLVAENIIGRMEENEDELVISGSIGDIHYNFTDESFGEAEAIGRSELSLTIPHSHDGILQNKTISGNVSVDKLVYHKDLEIEVTPATIDKFITLFNNALARLRHQEAEVKYSSAEPINLSIHINDSQTDSIQIVTPFATFPLTFDVWVLGNTNRPLLRGDVMNANTGFIGMQEVYEFELNSFRISWTDVPWQHGVVDVSSSQELPYCDEIENAEKETCPVNLDFQGTITNLQPTPSSNCGNESSAASIYYNIILGCIANQDNEATDWNKVAGKAIGKMISTTANKTLGGDYIGNIDMKVMLFENNTTNERDSSYFKLPISLDRWVKDLSLIFGYTQDQSENPTYDQSLQFGLNYTLPVFKDKSYSHKNHISPTTSLYAQLVSKQYLTNTGTEGNENRVEKNIGINYVYRYWNPCLLGIGKCETIQNPYEKKDETKPPLKKSETNK